MALVTIEHHEINGPHGRLEVSTGGPADGAALIYHHGTPGAGLLFEGIVDAGAERGVRIVSYARPGYGESARHEGRRIADCAADVAAVADGLGIERFYTAGASGGGPHALATAAVLGERVIAVASIAGVTPWNAVGFDFLAGMGPENLAEFGAAAAGQAQLRPWLEQAAAGLASVTPDQIAAELGGLLSEVDRAVMTGAFAAYLASECQVALRHGVDGWLDDDLAFVGEWGFEVGSISVPASVWQGDQDRFVPFSHGQWLAGHIPNAKPKLLAGEGHLSIVVGRWGEIVDDLIAAGSAA